MDLEMDLVASCKEKLAHFRIRELKDILTQLNLSKQGKKQDLIDRIIAVLTDEHVSGMWSKKNAVGKEEVAKLVDEIYRKLQDSGETELASKGQGVSDSNSNTKRKEKFEVPHQVQVEKVRCPCGSSLKADSTIQCEDQRCNVWQHIACVIIPEKPMEGILPAPPPKFYCELCRLGRADPFWVTVAHPLLPVKLAVTNAPTDGTNPMQSVEKTFKLTRADRDLLLKPEYDVQAWCMLLNDKVSFRMQWPQFAKLQINGVPMHAINRPGSQLLGANGRDDGPIITPCTREGLNKISLTGSDSRVFCLGVRIVKRRTVQQILNLLPKESNGERFEDALARVRRCVGGGAANENADSDSDSDLEVVADNISVNLRCPMSGSRMKIAGRFKPCVHMGCFDLEVFVEMNQRSRKWQCPICLKNYSLEDVIIDPYFTRITSKMRNCGVGVTEIEVKPDGSWRAKPGDERKSLGELGQWHLPDSTLCAPTEVESTPKLEALKQVKQEGGSEGHSTGLKLGMKKNKNGLWEVRKHERAHSLSSGRKLPENFMNNGHKAIPMSSSATGSGRDGEDTSVNQEGGEGFDYSIPNESELDSLSLNIDRNLMGSAGGDTEVIILSDSDEETENLISSGQIYNNCNPDGERISFSSHSLGIPEPHPELGLFNTDDDFEVPFWPSAPGNQCEPGLQFFDSDAHPTDTLADLHNGQFGTTSTGVGGYSLAGETSMGSTPLVPSSSHHQSVNINSDLVDNPLAFGGDDPSLQLFLPTRPSEAAQQVELTDQPPAMSNGFQSDDWISLRLGGGGVHCEPDAATNGLNLRQQPLSDDSVLDSLADTVVPLPGKFESIMVQTRNTVEGGDATLNPIVAQLAVIANRLESLESLKEDIAALKALAVSKDKGSCFEDGGSSWRHQQNQRPFHKIEFPAFSGGDPRHWILKAEKYFHLYHTPDDDKVDVAVMHLEGDALDLYSWLSTEQELTYWEELVSALQKHFGPPEFQNPDEYLCSIKQTGSVHDYKQEFARRSARVSNWPDNCLLGVFLNGLKEELKAEVRIHKPRTVYNAMSLAMEFESKINHVHPGKSGDRSSRIKTEGNLSSTTNVPTSGRIKKSTETRLSETEKQGRYLRGECFRCGEKYEPRYRCKNNTLKLLEAAGEEPVQVNLVKSGSDMAEMSLHAPFGEAHTTTMKFSGALHNTKVLILIDSGSTHNFISDALVREMKLLTEFVTPFGVQIGNGDIIHCHQICHDIPIQLSSLEITQDFYPLSLGGADVVLGIQWLSSLNNIQANWKEMFLSFSVDGKIHKLQGATAGSKISPTFQQLEARSEVQPTRSGKLQCWVFVSGTQELNKHALVRLEDKSSLRMGCNDTNPMGLLGSGQTHGSRKSGKTGSG